MTRLLFLLPSSPLPPVNSSHSGWHVSKWDGYHGWQNSFNQMQSPCTHILYFLLCHLSVSAVWAGRGCHILHKVIRDQLTKAEQRFSLIWPHSRRNAVSRICLGHFTRSKNQQFLSFNITGFILDKLVNFWRPRGQLKKKYHSLEVWKTWQHSIHQGDELLWLQLSLQIWSLQNTPLIFSHSW